VSKGSVLSSCGVLGMDWERVSLSMYLEAVEAHNSGGEGGGSAPPSEGFKAFMQWRFSA